MKQLSEINHWKESINQVMNCDCLELMRMMPDKCVDLCLTDPPYQLPKRSGQGAGKLANRKIQEMHKRGWDIAPTKELFNEIFRVSKNQIIWGGNYFDLPPTRGIAAWDKKQPWENFSAFELAWTSFDTVAKMFRMRTMDDEAKKEHPTQKPLELGRWCIENYAKEAKLIFDPFGGSGTFARAAKDAGIDFITCDKEVDYCEIMEERLKQETLF